MEENTNQNEKRPMKPNMGEKPVRPVKPGASNSRPNGNTNVRPSGASSIGTNSSARPTPRPKPVQTQKRPESKPEQADTELDDMDFDFDTDTEIVKTQPETKQAKKNNKVVKSQKNDTEETKSSSKTKKENKPKAEKKSSKTKETKTKQTKAKLTKEEKKQLQASLTPEQRKEMQVQTFKSILKTIIIVVILIVVLVVVLKVLGSGSDQHLTYADPVPSLEEQQAALKVKNTSGTSSSSSNSNDDTTNTDKLISENVSTEDIWKFTDNSKSLTAGSEMIFPVSVNTKLEGDEQYNEYYSFVKFKVNNIAIGYDNVISSIANYNQSGTSVLNVGSKENFYANNADNEIVMYDVTMTVPSDFPTQDSKNGRVFIEPNAELKLLGTTEEGSLITNKYVYAVPSLSNISDDVSEIYAGNTYHFKWIAIMPNDITGDMYEMELHLTQKDDDITYKIAGMDIADNSSTSVSTGVSSETKESEIETEESEVETETVENK
jgi:hypothetical protein